jgi:hypothetical protein
VAGISQWFIPNSKLSQNHPQHKQICALQLVSIMILELDDFQIDTTITVHPSGNGYLQGCVQ